MVRFLLRHGAVRLIGGRAVPALMLVDLALLANRARRVPIVDRNLRRGVGAARRGAESAITDRRLPRREDLSRLRRSRPPR
ncbi:MAG TPA: hypothetical protein VK194_11220 [Candidatus Deferrimicrobium sp.]|nr:hypothetical protein [Candidatus Deferrimicrobium sp.]